MGNMMKGLLALGAAVGAGIAAVEVIRAKGGAVDASESQPVEEQVMNQEVVETITGQMLSEWFQANETDGGRRYVSYLTDELSEIIGGNCNETLDREHYLIQWVSKEDGTGINSYRVINFMEMEPALEQLLQKSKGIIEIREK